MEELRCVSDSYGGLWIVMGMAAWQCGFGVFIFGFREYNTAEGHPKGDPSSLTILNISIGDGFFSPGAGI